LQSIPAEFYPSVFHSSYDEAVILNDEGLILDVNDKWKQFARDNGGDQHTFYVNHNYLQICSVSEGESEATAHLVLDGIRRVLRSDGDFRCEYPCHSPTVKRWFELTASPLQVGDKRYAVVTHRNITTRHIQTEKTISSGFQQNMLAAIVATSSDAIISYDLEGNILTWNYSATHLYGYTADEIIGRSMEVLYPEDWPARIGEYRDQILAGELTSLEVVRKRKDGKLRDVAVSAAPVRDQHGEVMCISNIHRDITEQKANEAQRKFITRELSHRAKNQLTVVRSIANQTAKNAASLEQFQRKFDDRVFSLAKSIDLLVSREWSTVSLEKLCRSQIELFSDSNSDNVVISGPKVVLAPAAVEAIGMALHELGTNAAKYGALSQAAGQISLTWGFSSEIDSDSLQITWRETGLEIDEAPSRKGFGHVVLTQLAKSSLGSDANLSFSHQGLHWEITVPSEFYKRS
jgi:PAS domain S-box-containing protein